jgi:hypothetical protein
MFPVKSKASTNPAPTTTSKQNRIGGTGSEI